MLFFETDNTFLGVVTIQWAKKGVRLQRKIIIKDKYLCIAISSHGNHGKLFFHLCGCQVIKTNQFDEILSLNFDLRPLKVNTYGVKQKSILQRTIKRTHTIKHIWLEKN